MRDRADMIAPARSAPGRAAFRGSALRADIARIGDATRAALLPRAVVAHRRAGHAVERTVGILVGGSGRVNRTGAERKRPRRDGQRERQEYDPHRLPPDLPSPVPFTTARHASSYTSISTAPGSIERQA